MEKHLSPLDQFVLDFIRVLGNREYVLVSGYVSILFGRARSSEDIDLLLSAMQKDEFLELFDELDKAGFECINVERDTAFSYLLQNTAVRFSRKGSVLPNMEVKFAKSFMSLVAVKDKIRVDIGKDSLFISPIELQIAYKRECLKSDKDVEDALHLEIVFEGNISKEKLKKYEYLIEQHGC